MMRSKNKAMSLLDGLTLLFVALKLIGIIEWPWVWVTSPVWIPFLIAFVSAFITVVFKLTTNRVDSKKV